MSDEALNDAERAELARLRAEEAARNAPTVTRDVPPKSAVVNPGVSLSYAGVSYHGAGVVNQATGEVKENPDTILHGEGPVLDDFQRMGLVTVVSHDETDAWNGKQGDAIRKRALKIVDDNHAATGSGKRDHDHGFVKFEVAS